jgi:phosphate transport system substrate-binding protein
MRSGVQFPSIPCADALLPRRIVLAGSALAITLRLLSGSAAAASPRPGLLRIGGTGMALATMHTIGAAYAAERSDVTIEVLKSLGTGGGLSAVAEGAIDLALAARPLGATESGNRLISQAYASTPVAFVTSPGTVIDDIGPKDVSRIFSGDLVSWPNGDPIRLVRRDPSDADWSMLRHVSPDMSQAVDIALRRPGLLTVATDQENADALERLSGSFGALSIGQLRAEQRRLKPLALDSITPTIAALESGRYKLSRTLYVAWRAAEPSELASSFMAFLRGREASAILAQLGHVPLA